MGIGGNGRLILFYVGWVSRKLIKALKEGNEAGRNGSGAGATEWNAEGE